MSIIKVEVMNSRGNLLALSLEDISNGYVVKDIDGLGPVKATIVSSDFAGVDGQQEQASSREIRNVTIKLGYAPNFGINETVRVLRSRLYDFFMTATKVTLTFYMADGLEVKTTGTVESCEPAIFSREPEMDISIICFDPDFIDTELTSISGVFTTTDTTPHVIQVNGSSKTGLTSLSFTAAKAMSDFTIYHTTPSGDVQTMLVSVPLLVGDVINLSSIKRQKSITLTRSGVTTSILWAVSPQSIWVLLEPGVNQLYLNGSSTGPSSPVLVQYNNRYGGL